MAINLVNPCHALPNVSGRVLHLRNRISAVIVQNVVPHTRLYRTSVWQGFEGDGSMPRRFTSLGDPDQRHDHRDGRVEALVWLGKVVSLIDER
jgi:hypothetical protein